MSVSFCLWPPESVMPQIHWRASWAAQEPANSQVTETELVAFEREGPGAQPAAELNQCGAWGVLEAPC